MKFRIRKVTYDGVTTYHPEVKGLLFWKFIMDGKKGYLGIKCNAYIGNNSMEEAMEVLKDYKRYKRGEYNYPTNSEIVYEE